MNRLNKFTRPFAQRAKFCTNKNAKKTQNKQHTPVAKITRICTKIKLSLVLGLARLVLSMQNYVMHQTPSVHTQDRIIN
jgi:hypothetical protein